MRSFVLVLLIAVSSSTPAAAAGFAEIGEDFQPADVTADGGTVVGTLPTPEGGQAYRWTEAAGLTPLGSLLITPPEVPECGWGQPRVGWSSARAVSSDGSVIVGAVGQTTGAVGGTPLQHVCAVARATRFTPAPLVLLGLDPSDDVIIGSEASDASANGSVVVGKQIVGSGIATTVSAVLFGDPTSTVLCTQCEAKAVSADGSVVVGNGPASADAFRWTSAGGLQTGFGNPSDPVSFSLVSADGSTIVGKSGVAVARWRAGSGRELLLPYHFTIQADGHGLSADGATVVGVLNSSGSAHAVLWRSSNQAEYLSEVLRTQYSLDLTSSHRLTAATAISGDGRFVVGTALRLADARNVAYRVDLAPDCVDEVDNDGDGSADLADPGCSSASDASERDPGFVCDDGVDNDGDGRVDYAEDVGCAAIGGGRENPQCQDGIDNDGQSGIDFDGGSSLDLDEDGHVDASFNPGAPPIGAPDPQCVNTPSRNAEAAGCGLGPELTLLIGALTALRRARESKAGG